MDMFANTGGIHAAALVFLAFIRPFILNLLLPAEEYEEVESPNIWELGVGWYVLYTMICIVVHHLTLFLLEVMSFSQLFFVLGRVITSSSITLLLVLIYAYFFHRPQQQLLH
jgi:hypothetical protein